MENIENLCVGYKKDLPTVNTGWGDINDVPFICLVITSGGVKKEGESVPAYFSTSEAAWAAYYKEIIQYDILAWRRSPELKCKKLPVQLGFEEFGPDKWYCAHSRIAVSC